MKIYFTIQGFRILCSFCVMNGHNLIAHGEPTQDAPPNAKCDCGCHK